MAKWDQSRPLELGCGIEIDRVRLGKKEKSTPLGGLMGTGNARLSRRRRRDLKSFSCKNLSLEDGVEAFLRGGDTSSHKRTRGNETRRSVDSTRDTGAKYKSTVRRKPMSVWGSLGE